MEKKCYNEREFVNGEAKALDIGERLVDELNCKDIFSFDIFGLNITIKESIVVMWIIMAVIMILSVLLTRNLKIEGKISKRQLFLEMCVEKMANFFRTNIGEGAEEHLSWLMSLAVLIGASNMVGIFGFKPPTKDINVTMGLALCSIIYIQYASIHARGTKGWLKSFAQPSPIVVFNNVLELGIKPLSLCMRLFGNIIGAYILMELIKMVVPVFVPIVLSLYFDIFDGFIQAYVFVFLNSVYIQEAIGNE